MAAEQVTVKEARKLLLSKSYGTIATHSLDAPGYPYGSLIPFCLDAQGQPIILISRLAEHTRNIADDPRVSLLVSAVDEAGFKDVQTTARLTLIADAERVFDSPEDDWAKARYSRFFPHAEFYSEQLDFDFYRLKPLKARYVADFGKVYWVDIGQLFAHNPFSDSQESEICSHMNDDHANALYDFCANVGQPVPENIEPKMVGLDALGFSVALESKVLRFWFPDEVLTPGDVRRALVTLLKDVTRP